MNILALSWKNILYKPLNTLLSVLLFALSIGLITFLLLFNHHFTKGLDNNLAGVDLVIGAKGSPLQLILNSMYHIDAPTGNITIEESGPFLNPQHPLIKQSVPLSLGDSYGAYRIVGAPQSILTFYGAEKVEGNIYKEDYEVLVGSVPAEKLKLEIGDEFFSTHGLEENPDLAHDHGSHFLVTGILHPTGTVLDQLILCTPMTIWKVHEHDTVSETHSHNEGKVQSSIAHPTTLLDTGQIQILSARIIDTLRSNPDKEITSVLIRYKNRTSIPSLNLLRNINQNTGLMAASPSYEINRLYSMMGSGADAIRYLAILIAIVAAVSVFISLYTSLKDRRYEMALMRVSGAGPGQIWWMIIAEGLWISALGVLIGLFLGHTGMILAGDMLEKNYHYSFSGTVWLLSETYIIIGALLIGFLASIIPAIQGSHTELHKTLAEN